MQHKTHTSKNTTTLSNKPEDIAKKELEIENLKIKIAELNKILENFSKNNATRKND
ncbi:hypothetical protein WH243_06055 [Acinetobacter sp. MYb177]|jgi:hypothetical protein|uniref:hypothetical protein n=1 Tax=Acinetobacter TaxID=469 RepID=UPI001CCD6C7E|nr:hypothetical protein [Acinetobacter johnsonii]UBQ37557.1 hypothetical protein LCH18_15610 [Acinetobacter johnsonii]